MLAARRPPQPIRITLLALVFALAWYYFSFHLFWKAVSPAIAVLHAEQSTIVGHLIYGLFLGRFYAYYGPAEKPSAEAVTREETAPNSVAPGA
jgi:hypothetical protein